jgi:hypothetical protein
MDVEKLIAGSKGKISETMLRGDRDGYVPPGVVKWPPGKSPKSHIEKAEQPHFQAINTETSLKVRGNGNTNIMKKSRLPLDQVQNGIIDDGNVGYIGSEDPYPTILIITDHRFLFILAINDRNETVEFRYDDTDVDEININDGLDLHSFNNKDVNEVFADGMTYEFDIWVHPQERESVRQFLSEETELEVRPVESAEGNEPTSEEENQHYTPSKRETTVELADLLGLTPEGFEEYISDVWRAQGYSCRTTQSSRDSGVDVIAEDKDERTLIQAKRYTDNNIGIETVQRVAGLLVDDEFDANEVKIITTSGFTSDAKSRARQISQLTLVNGTELITIGNEVGVEIKNNYEKSVTESEILSVVDSGEPKTTAEIDASINGNQKSIILRLQSLLEKNKIQAKEIADNRIIWYKA